MRSELKKVKSREERDEKLEEGIVSELKEVGSGEKGDEWRRRGEECRERGEE